MKHYPDHPTKEKKIVAQNRDYKCNVVSKAGAGIAGWFCLLPQLFT